MPFLTFARDTERALGKALPRTTEATGEASVAANARILFESYARSGSDFTCSGKVQSSNVSPRRKVAG